MDYSLVDVSIDDFDAAQGWCSAVSLGFHRPEPTMTRFEEYRAQWRADRAELLGCYPAERVPDLAANVPVGTFESFVKSINVGGGSLVDAHLITDVTVRPSHRRRGILTRMMNESLRRAHEAGRPLALLTATEATIYGRFGFGITASQRAIEVSTRRAGIHVDRDGRTELVDPLASWPDQCAVYDRFHAVTKGSVRRPAIYEGLNRGTINAWSEPATRWVRVAVHRGVDRAADGYAVYSADEETGVVTVLDLVAATPDVELQLWGFLSDIDLVSTLSYHQLIWGSPLPYALTDVRSLTTTAVKDSLWMRILDVPAALSARGWESDGAVSFRIDDRMGYADGCWRLEVSGGEGHVTPCSDASLVMRPSTLSNLYLGDVDARTLASAGAIRGSRDDIEALGALFASRERPNCITYF